MLTINPVKTNNNINFQGKTRIRAIKYIPNITCACCGKKLILPDNLAKAWKSISKPISFIMKKGLLDKWTKRSDSIAAVLNKFVQTEPEKPLEKILDNQENYHEFKNALLDYVKSRHPDSDADTNDEYVNRVLDSIRKNSREILKGASPVMKRLAVFKKNLHGLKRDIFEQFQIYAEKYPRKTLSEIVNMDEIYKFHSAKNFLQRAETRERLDYHFSNIKKMIVKQKPELADFADDLKEKALKIYAAEADPKIKLHKMKELYMEALESNNLAKLKFKVADELKLVPESFSTVDSFFTYAKNHNWTDYTIISSILTPHTSSYEHIIPRSENGEDKYSNGLVLCSTCNSTRKSMPYEEFLKYHPEMIYNTQRQMDMISKYILSGKLPEVFNFYPIKTAKTLYDYTNGLMNIDVSSYCKKALSHSENRIKEKTQAISRKKDERDKTIMKKIKLQQEIRNVDESISRLNKQVSKLREREQIEKSLHNNLLNYLKTKEKKK